MNNPASAEEHGLKFSVKGRVHCFSMQVGVDKCFLLNPEKNFGVDPFCRFWEKRKKRTFNSEKWRHRAEG